MELIELHASAIRRGCGKTRNYRPAWGIQLDRAGSGLSVRVFSIFAPSDIVSLVIRCLLTLAVRKPDPKGRTGPCEVAHSLRRDLLRMTGAEECCTQRFSVSVAA
jgi:hypothetical protein